MSQTHAEKMLEKIEAVLEGRLEGDINQYSIAGRLIVKIPILELTELRDRYKAEVNQEKTKKNVEAGQKNPRFIGAKF